MTDRELRKKAWKRVKRMKGFYHHLSAFIIVGMFFFVINVTTDPFNVWFFHPMLPWAVALAFHYVSVFGIPGTSILTKGWEEREFEKQYDRLEAEHEHEYFDTRKKGRYLNYSELSDEQHEFLSSMNRPQSSRDFV